MMKVTENLKKLFRQDDVRLCIDNILFLDGYLFVRGWALDGKKPVRSMTIRAEAFNGSYMLNVRPKQLRETVAQVFKLDGEGRYAGFEAELEGLDSDQVSIEIDIDCETADAESASDTIRKPVTFEIGSVSQVRSSGRNADDGVLILTEAAEGGPCRRYRGDHLAEELTKHGIRAEVININRGFEAEQLNYRHLVLQRVWFPFYQRIVEVFKREGGSVFFEVDDAIFSYELCMENDYLNQLPDETRLDTNHMAELIGQCDGIITSTDYLAGIVRESFPGKPVYVNQNVASDRMTALSETARRSEAERRVKEAARHLGGAAAGGSDDGLFGRVFSRIVRAVNVSQTGRGTQVHEPKRNEKKADTVTIGYFSGTNTHNRDLEMIADVLADVLKKHKNTRLLLAGQIEVPEALAGMKERTDRFDPVAWTKLPELIARADINLVPLEDTTFNKCKSAIKWLEAALVGVPTVATMNDEFSRVVRDGETGLLCSNEEEWREALERLVTDGELRKQLSEAARKEAFEKYTTDTINEELLWILSA